VIKLSAKNALAIGRLAIHVMMDYYYTSPLAIVHALMELIRQALSVRCVAQNAKHAMAFQLNAHHAMETLN
jgi:hypothetical protein